MAEYIEKDKFRPLEQSEDRSEYIARPVITYWSDAWRRFKANKTAIFAFIVLIFLIVMVIIGPMISGYSHEEIVGMPNQTQSKEFWFGTDDLGRDIFTRVWKGGRISIFIGLMGAIIGTVVGSIYGAISWSYFCLCRWCCR